MDLGLSEVRDLVVPVPVIKGVLEEVTCVAEGTFFAAEGTCFASVVTCVVAEVTCVAEEGTFVAAVETLVADNDGWNSLMSGREAEDSWENELKD